MADQVLTPPTYVGVIDTTHHAETKLPAAAGGLVSRWLIELESSSFSGSITIKGRRAGGGGSWKAIPYIALYLNGAVSDGALHTSTITDTSLIEVDSSGMEVDISGTSFVSGSMAVGCTPLEG
jgi:hypothetical protein